MYELLAASSVLLSAVSTCSKFWELKQQVRTYESQEPQTCTSGAFCFVRTQSQADRHQYRRQAIFLLVSQSSFQRQPHLALTHRLTVSTKLIHHTMCSLLVPSTLHATAFVVCGSGTTVCGTPSTGKLGSEFSMQALSSDDVRCISPHQPGKAAKVGLFVSARVFGR